MWAFINILNFKTPAPQGRFTRKIPISGPCRSASPFDRGPPGQSRPDHRYEPHLGLSPLRSLSRAPPCQSRLASPSRAPPGSGPFEVARPLRSGPSRIAIESSWESKPFKNAIRSPSDREPPERDFRMCICPFYNRDRKNQSGAPQAFFYKKDPIIWAMSLCEPVGQSSAAQRGQDPR